MGFGPTLAKGVTRMLDNPHDPISGERIPHKELHNKKGIMMAYLLYGKDGADLAMTHMLEDRLSEHFKSKYGGKGDFHDLMLDMMVMRMLRAIGKSFHRPSIYHP